jgi:hypothetical protein
MALNLNVEPYFDDFDPSKNYHRILYKPGYAVQGRELTQSQTILQNQISNFADAIFSQNTPVSGGKITTNFNVYYLKLQRQYLGTDIDVNNFLNKDIQDLNGVIRGKVIAVAEGTTSDFPTLIVSYYSGVRFTDASVIFCSDGSNFVAQTIGSNTTLSTCTGKSSVASISSGIFYVINGYNISNTQNPDGTYSKYSIGNFVSVLPQTAILDKYGNNPSYRVGLSITETIVDYVDDSSLLDPAVGASNYQAPGADRLKISLELITLPLALGNDDQFIELLRIENGKILKQVDGTVYSVIDDYFAKRTYETNGDYIVNDFRFTPSSNTINSNVYDLKISKGLAYVRGYRIENQSDFTITSNRARTTNSINNNQVYVDYGSYVVANNFSGTFDITTMPKVDLHCVANASVVSTNSVTYSSTLVGSAFVRNLDFESSTLDSDTSTYIYKLYITDVSANTLSGVGNATGSSATTIKFVDTNGKFSSVANAYYGVKISATTSGYTDVREIVSYDGTTKTATVNSPFTLDPTDSTTFNLLFSTADIESVVRVPAGPATPTVRTASADITNSGKFNGLNTGDTLFYNPNQPELLFDVGYSYVSNISDSSYVSQKVFRAKSLTSSGPNFVLTLSIPVDAANIKFIGTGTLSSDAIKQNFTVINRTTRKVLDFVSSGNTVSISSDQKTATFTTPAYGTATVDVIAGVSVTNADNTTLVLKAKNLVTGNTQIVSYAGPTAIVNANTYLDLTNGQVYIKNAVISNLTSLYVSDVKKIRKIINTKSPATVPTTSMLSDSSYDVTNLFDLDNGQRDTYYDFAAIDLKPGASIPPGNLLVIFDYYAHTGGDGYFSVNSYLSPVSSSPEQYREISSYTSKAGNLYRLSDALDFRPAREAPSGTVSSVPFVLEYTGNPTTPDDSGILIPQNLSYFTHDYAYYLGRKDKLVLTKDRTFNIIEGTPSVDPSFPVEPDGSLILANLSLDPYTGYIPGEDTTTQQSNLSLEKIQHKNWIKKDITDLQDRVNNLEYYTALSILEQNARSLQIPDSNGLNRFKNGILVDDFSSYLTADTSTSVGFNAKIDTIKKQLTAKTIVDNFSLVNPLTRNSLNTIRQTNTFYAHPIQNNTTIYTLPYVKANIASQVLASSVISLNPFGVVLFDGAMNLNPPMDNWVDNQQAPDILVTAPGIQVFQENGTTNYINSGNWQTIPGTTYTTTSSVSQGNAQITTRGTYADQLQNILSSGYSPISSIVGLSNGYLTNIAILPYIRPQEIIFRAEGLLANQKVSAYFDGQKVDQYIQYPDTVKVSGVQGTFNEDDIVGFYDSNEFTPVGRVLSVNPIAGQNANVYLSISEIFGAPSYVSNQTFQNAVFDENGNYVSSSANGYVQGTSLIKVSGTIEGVGGVFNLPANTTANLIYQVSDVKKWSKFLNLNGMWGRSGPAKKFLDWTAEYEFDANVAGNYVIEAGSWRRTSGVFGTQKKTATISVNNSVIITASELYDATPANTVNKIISLPAGTHKIQISANGSTTDVRSALAVVIREPVNTPGRTDVFNALYPPSLVYNSGSQIVLPMGGAWFTDVTRIALANTSSEIQDFYTGSEITVTSKYLYTYIVDNKTVPAPIPLTSGGAGDGGITSSTLYVPFVGKDKRRGYVLQSIETHTATITAYDPITKLATLSNPINVSFGSNDLFGNITSQYSIRGATVSIEEAIQNGTTVPALSTDSQGRISGVFSVPASTFKTGERVFRIDNRIVESDLSTATTFAEGTFTASGLSTTTQNIEFSPSVDSASKSFIRVNQRDAALVQRRVTVTYRDPLAQTFLIDKENFPNGAFLNSIKVFFATKPTTVNSPDVELSIVGTENGYPNGKTLDYSIVRKKVSEINVSTSPHYLDAATATEFTFKAPVYIQPGTLYAFILTTTSPDYTVYYAQQNSTAVSSTAKQNPTDPNPTNPTKIGQSPYIGGLFESQNGITWQVDQSKQMMFVIDQCIFNKSINPNIEFSLPIGLPFRSMGRNDIVYNLNPGVQSNLMGNFSQQIPGIVSDAVNVTTTDFSPTGTSISYTASSVLNNGANTVVGPVTVFPGRLGSPNFEDIGYDDGQGPRILLNGANNSFRLFASMSTTDANTSPIISDDGISIYNVRYMINNLNLSNSMISVVNGGTGYFEANVSATVSNPDIGSDVATCAVDLTANVITNVYLTNPGSGYIKTPTITITGGNTTSAVVTVLGETSARGGNQDAARYVTKKVVLTPENESGDLRVFYTAYKPIGTEIYVYYKILNNDDTDNIDAKEWQLMTQTTTSVYSLSKQNLIEFECAPGVNGEADNYVSYTKGTETYNTFNQFQIKIVMSTTDTSNIPFLTDIRALAVPSGTGI